MTRKLAAALAACTLTLGIAVGAVFGGVARGADTAVDEMLAICQAHMAQMGSMMSGQGMMGGAGIGASLHSQHHPAQP